MWLLGQILIYLILAFLIGGVGGWMLRGRRAQDDQAQLRERFKQMVSSIEMERDAARLKARDLGVRLEELEGTRGARPADDEQVSEARSGSTGREDTAEPSGEASEGPEADDGEEQGSGSTAPGAEDSMEPQVEAAAAPDPTDQGGYVDSVSAEADAGSPATAQEDAPQVEEAGPDETGAHDPPHGDSPASAARWELVEESEASDGEEAALTAEAAADQTETAARPLSALGEVPPEASRTLRTMGIEDTSALHGYFADGADPSALAASLGVEARRVRRWRTLAELLELPTVDAPHAWLLEIAGVATLEELAAEDPSELTQRMIHLNRDQGLGLPVPDRARVAGWVEGAGQRQGRV